MAVDVKKLIAAISPDVYCDNVPRDGKVPLVEEVKKKVKEEGYLKAAEIAELRDSPYLDIKYARFTKSAFDLEGLKAPMEKHSLVYDAFAQNLEPIYFWILDFVNDSYGSSEILIDNFKASAGSGHFSEMQRRMQLMRDEGMKMMQTAGVLLKSLLNIIYDMKEWKLKLYPYDDLKSKNPHRRKGAVLSLKQTWMDTVDIKRQTTSLKGFAQQPDFVTIIDAFLAADSLKAMDSLDLNDRVKRILHQRYFEFEKWLKVSEEQLRKRYEIERIYLKSQVNNLRLYAKWAKPYFKSAKQLEQNADATSALVTMFNVAVFELVLLAKGKYDIQKDIDKGDLPKSFKKLKTRKYTPITVIEFRFRSIPDRTGQQDSYSFRGRAEVQFTSFALNEDELKVLKEQIDEDDFGDVYRMIEGATDESLGQLKDDLDELLGEKEEDKKKEKKKEDVNPFTALFSFFKKEDKKKDEDFSKGIPPDTAYEKVLRSQAILGSRWSCRILYDIYKKAHGMPMFPPVIY